MDATPIALTAADAQTWLSGSAFARALAVGSPLVLAIGQPRRVAFATPAALEAFRARDTGELDSILFASESSGARRLRRLGEDLPVGAAPRLQRLWFSTARVPSAFDLMCARVAGPEGTTALVLASPMQAGEAASAKPASAAPPEEQVQTKPEAVRDIAPPIRFLWSLDAEHRFGAPDESLSGPLGPNAPQAGETLDALRARLGFDPEGVWTRAVALRATFGGLKLHWPQPDLSHARVVSVSGAPTFDRQRNFAGFRGFGVLTGETTPLAAVEPDEPPAPHGEDASLPEEPTTAASTTTEIEAPASAERRETPPAPEASDIVAPAPAREGGGNVFVLRPPGPPHGANVVPLIRPGALPPLPPAADEASGAAEDGSVALSSQERDAFKEIARALGARMRGNREGDSHAEDSGPPDEEAPVATEAKAHDSGPAASDAWALLDRLPIAALVLRGGQPLYLNRTLLDLTGYPDLDAFRAAGGLDQIFRGRNPEALAADGESGFPLVAANGEILAVQGHASALSWQGQPATLIALRRSRGETHQAELRSLDREARAHQATARDLASALDVAAGGMIRLDATGRILGMNPRAETLFGYDQKEVAGESALMLLAPQSHAEATARLDRVVREGAAAHPGDSLEATARDHNGRLFPVRLAFGRLGGGREREYCAIVVDLSLAKAAERERELALENAEKQSALKTEFLARVSHEIRTPLHAILGFAEVMMEERFGPIGNERYKDYIKDIHASGQHVASLANDLLDLSKIEAGKMELEFAPVDANRIIRECVTLMQPQAARERIIMRLSLFDRLPNVMADERSLRQIVLNLMSNAVKFNEPGGQVIVSTALDEAGHPTIRVRDTGVGMNETEVVAAMEPFRQVGSGRRDGGTGLGLPLTKALAEANHADFSIKSRKEHGTLVEIAFPSVQAAQ